MSETTPSTPTSTAGVLIVDDKPDAVDLLNRTLLNEGYRIFTARNGEEALRVAGSQLPDLVLMDLAVPGTNGLEVCKALKSNARTEDIVVIFLSAINDANVKTRGLKLGAIDYIQKPFNPTELRARIQAHLRLKNRLDTLRRNYQEICEQLNERTNTDPASIDRACVQSEIKVLSFPSDIAKVQGIINQLLVGIEGRLGERVRGDLALGIHEMVLNAIEHGNFGITSEEKSAAFENRTFQRLLEDRQSDPQLAARLVTIEYEFDGEKVVYAIEDEGDGFDWRTVIAREEPEDLLSSNGRGILISRYVFDSITYNDKGNRVTLEKKVL